MELCVEGFALSENFVIRCDKFMFINFVIIHCTQCEVPFARLRKYFVFLVFIVPFDFAPRKFPPWVRSLIISFSSPLRGSREEVEVINRL